MGAIAFDTTQLTHKANRSNPQPGDPCHPLASGAHAPAIAFAGMAQGGAGWAPPSCPTSEDVALPLDATRAQAVAFQSSQSGMRIGDQHPTLDSHNGSRRHCGAMQGMSVRRLLPVECEKLQGFPPGFTAITWRGKPAADGPRYRALGNAMAVPVIGWVLRRIREFEESVHV